MQQPTDHRVSRREFIQTSAAVAAGVAVGLKPTYTIAAGNPAGADTSKILNYNADMEYRLCGKTGWMISAVCLGGHWKRVDQMVPGIFGKGSWLSADLNNAEFQKNRHDVVTRCIERGINYIDACTHAEITAYLGNRIVLEALGGIAWRRKSQRGETTRDPSDPLLKGR